MRFIVHIREKRTGKVVVAAEDEHEAAARVKRMIHTKSLPTDALDRESGIIVTFTEQEV